VSPQLAWAPIARKVFAPVAAVILAVLVGSLIIWLAGDDPVAAFSALLQGAFGGSAQIGETLMRSTPLIIVGVGLAYGFRAGLFNIGAEGQLFIGGMAGAYFGLVFGAWSGWVGIPVVLVLAAAAGAAWAFIPAILKARVGAHEVITTMMFTYIARYLVGWLVIGPLKAPGQVPQTDMLPQSMRLPMLSSLSGGVAFGRAHVGFLLAVALAVAVWAVLKYTGLGFEARAVGFSPTAAENGGISIAATTVKSLCISGAFAGVAGAAEVLGVYHRIFETFSSGLGFTGIAVALLARNNPIAVIPSAILFGALYAGAPMMQLEAGVSKNVIFIIQGLIIFFVASETVIDSLIQAAQKRAVAHA